MPRAPLMQKTPRARLIAITALLVVVVVEVAGSVLYYAGLPSEKRERLELMIGESSTWRNSAARYRGHPFLGYTGDPDFVDPSGYKPYGPDGFRVRAPFREGAVRVVVLGGSTTFGLLAPRTEDAWPALLGRALEEHIGAPVDVVNAGLPNYAMWNLLAVGSLWLPEWEPDIVIVHTGFNDAFMRAYPDEGGADGAQAKIVWSVPELGFVEHVVLAMSRAARVMWLPVLEKTGRLTGDLLLASSRPPPSDDDVRKNAEANNGIRFRRQVKTLMHLVESTAAEVVLVGVPVSSDTSPRGAFFDVGFEGARQNARALETIARELGKTSVSLEHLTSPAHFVDGVHMTEEAELLKVSHLRTALASLVRVHAMKRGLLPVDGAAAKDAHPAE